MSEPSKDLPLAGPYCSDPNCEYCKELRQLFEQELGLKMKRQKAMEGLSSSSGKPKSPKREPPAPLPQRESA
jgi:hypothetical protein